MGQYAQFDLRIVGREQEMSGRGDERTANTASLFAAHPHPALLHAQPFDLLRQQTLSSRIEGTSELNGEDRPGRTQQRSLGQLDVHGRRLPVKRSRRCAHLAIRALVDPTRAHTVSPGPTTVVATCRPIAA